MFERFTDDARSVVVWAQEEAVSRRQREIGTEHLLVGVLRVDDPALQATGRAFGLTLDGVRNAVHHSVRRGWRAPSGHIPFNAPARQALEQSLRVAAKLHQRQVRPAHLLIAVLADPDCRAVQALRATGVDTAALAEAARAALTGAPVAAGDEPAGDEPDGDEPDGDERDGDQPDGEGR